MKVKVRFLVYNIYGIGGTVRTVCNFASYLQSTKKYEVEIVSIRRTANLPVLELHPEVRVIALQDARRSAVYSDEEKNLLSLPSKLISPAEDLYPMFNAYTDMRLREFFSSLHDGVLITTIPSFNHLAATMVEHSVLRIGMEHKSYEDHAPEIQSLIRKSYSGLDVLTILTEKNRHVYRNKLRMGMPIYVLANGTKRLGFRASLKKPMIIAFGRYAYQKGYDMLIRAFGKIAPNFPRWKLEIYGDGSLEKSYISLVRELKLQRQVLLKKGKRNINEEISSAAFQVCSSYYEPFGMSIIEGLAMGVPCVSFECDGPNEILTHEYDGLLVPKEDINELAKSMARLMSDEALRAEFGKNAYETAARYDLKKIGGDLDHIIMEHLDSKNYVPCIIYGAGDEGRKAYEKYKSQYNVVCFVDRDATKQGKELLGVPIRPPEFLSECPETKVLLSVRRNKGI